MIEAAIRKLSTHVTILADDREKLVAELGKAPVQCSLNDLRLNFAFYL